jgi:hypothetical protein
MQLHKADAMCTPQPAAVLACACCSCMQHTGASRCSKALSVGSAGSKALMQSGTAADMTPAYRFLHAFPQESSSL